MSAAFARNSSILPTASTISGNSSGDEARTGQVQAIESKIRTCRFDRSDVAAVGAADPDLPHQLDQLGARLDEITRAIAAMPAPVRCRKWTMRPSNARGPAGLGVPEDRSARARPLPSADIGAASNIWPHVSPSWPTRKRSPVSMRGSSVCRAWSKTAPARRYAGAVRIISAILPARSKPSTPAGSISRCLPGSTTWLHQIDKLPRYRSRNPAVAGRRYRPP
jgi:hypothetical protein